MQRHIDIIGREEFEKENRDRENRELITRDIAHNHGMYSDAGQIWSKAYYCTADNIDGLKPLISYEEQFSRNSGSAPYLDLIMMLSNPVKVAEFNSLVDTFNEELPRIIAERNFPRANDLAKMAWKVIKGK